ncbi:MAG: polysaccharide biosynthesis protein [Lachnospiraceae bacterium]|nr:polysaccharide biosynthesis protein [Lachnospiraceae bacterium]
MGDKKNNSFYVQGTILAAASILTRIMGIAFRIPLTRIIGDEGIGAYSNAYEVYNMALLLSTYSIPIAVSKLVSARESQKEYKNSYRVFLVAMLFAAVSGAAASLVTFFGAELFSTVLFKSASSAIPLKYLAPTIFVFAVMGVLRGFFQGKNTMIPTAISQLIEQFFHVVVGLAAAVGFMKMYEKSESQVAYGAAGGTFGTLIGAVTSLAFLGCVFFMYYPVLKRRLRKDAGTSLESYQDILKLVLLTIFPIILNQTLYSVSGTLDSVLLNSVLDSQGVPEETRLVLWGRYSSKYRLLANLPLSIASAIGVAIVPNIVRAFTERNQKQLHEKIGQAVKFNMMIAIPSAFGLAVLAGPVMELLFNDTTEMTALLMQTGAAAIVAFAYSTTTNNILQGMSLMKYPVIHAGVGLVIYVIVDYVLLAYCNMGVYALVVGYTVFPLVVSVLNWVRIQNETGYVQEWKKTFLMPTLCSAVMAFVAYFSYRGIFAVTEHLIISLAAAIFFAVFTYFVLMIVTKTLDEAELYELPMGGRIVRLAKLIGLL